MVNPCAYARSENVELDLEALGVPPEMGEADLALLRDHGDEPVNFQIDRPFGADDPARLLTFLAQDVPPGKADYSSGGKEAIYRLVNQRGSAGVLRGSGLSLSHFYSKPKPGENADGSPIWDRARSNATDGVKVANDKLRVYIRTRRMHSDIAGVSLVGGATSVDVPEIRTNTGDLDLDFLAAGSPFHETSTGKMWGQLTHLTFRPPPWQWSAPEETVSLLDVPYDVVWSNVGPVRAAVSLRSGPISLRYQLGPGGPMEVLQCHLFRMFSTYATGPFPYYEEQLFVRLVKVPSFLWFRPHFVSRLRPSGISTNVHRFDHIPDYFSTWRHPNRWSHWGFLYGSDVHTRSVCLNRETSELSWALQTTNRARAIHGFLFHCNLPPAFDPTHIVGHCIWYERLWKPLRACHAGLMPPVPLPYH